MAIIPQIITEDRASGAQVIDGSLKFDSTAGDHLLRTPSSEGYKRVWTWSGWVKRQDLDSFRRLFEAGSSTSNFTTITWQGDNNSIELMSRTGGSNSFRVKTARLFRDLSGWYHVTVSMNMSLAGTDKCKIYINGERITDFDDNTQSSSNTYDTFINSTNNHFVGSAQNETNTYNGYMSQVYLIDGQELGPEYFGFTDPLTGTWRPKKFKSSINNGTTWSNDLTTANPDDGFRVSPANPATLSFDGSIVNSTATESTVPGNQIVWSPTQFPAANGPYTLEVLCNGAGANGGWAYRLLKVNGTTVYDPSVDSLPTDYVTVSNLTEITEVIVQRDGTTGRSRLDSIRVNGVPLIDGATNDFGTNGFYLPFDGNSPIGEDKSGNGNNWTTVNFGGSNTIEKATGALPILNTVNGGTTAAAGIRPDAYASNLFLALPLIGNTADVSHLINSGSTEKTVATNTNVDASSLQSNFYGGSHRWNANSDFLSYSEQGNELVLGTGDFTVECWVYDDNSHDGNNSRCYIWDNRVGGSVVSGPIMLAYIDGHQEWNIEVGGNSLIFDVGPSYTTERGNWHHLAVTRESGTIKMWLDGVEKASASNSSNITTNGIGIGCADTSGYGWAGYIQDFRIYKGVAKYTSDFIPASTNPDILPDTPSGVAYGSELKQSTEGSVNGGVSNGDTLLVGNNSDFNFGSGDFTVELFAYHTSTAGNDTLVGMWNSGANRRTWMIDIEADQGRLRGYWSTDGSTVSNVQTATNYIARRRWNHIVFCRQGNTMRLYLNGYQEATATESGSLYNNINDSLGILSATDAGNDPCRGHISSVRIIKGTCLYPDGTSFTPPSAPLTNVTNTVLLACQSPTSATAYEVSPGTITTSGNVSASAFNPFTDDINTVRGQESLYCTLNPLEKNSKFTLSENNLKFTNGTSNWTGWIGGTQTFKTGKWYWEVRIDVATQYHIFGIVNTTLGSISAADTYQYAMAYQTDGRFYAENNSTSPFSNGNPSAQTVGDICSIAVDMDNKKMWLGINGEWTGGANPSDGYLPNWDSTRGFTNGDTYMPVFMSYGSSGQTVNFGQKPFRFTPPDGFQPLCLNNLPRPTKAGVRPDKHFNTVLWTGDDSTDRSITTGFRPDFVWVKARNQAYSHHLYDSVRGPSKRLLSNGTQSEFDQTSIDGVSSFNSDGFDVSHTNSDAVNQLNTTYIAWTWKGGTPENYVPSSASVLFDGSGDYLSLTSNSNLALGTSDFTIEFWVYLITDQYSILFDMRPSPAATQGVYPTLYLDSGTGTLRYYTDSSDRITGANLQAGRWYHIAVSRSGSSTKMFLDGVQQGTTYSDSNDYLNGDTTIGYRADTSTGPLNGYMSNVRVVKGTALYTSNFTPPTEPLTNVTGTELLCCQSATSASAATVTPGTFVNNGTNYSSNNQVTGSAGLVNADSIFNGHLRASGIPTLNEGATVSLSSDNYILWTPTTGIPYNSKVEVFCYAPNGYGITTYYTFNGGTETSFVGGSANYNGNTWITVATGSGTINSIKLRLTRSPGQSQVGWYAVRVDGTILLNDQNGGAIGRYDNASANTYNPFDNYRVDGRVYATAAEAGLNGGTITPTGASVNTESGFSIITYTGDGSTSSGVTINHGLGDTPAFIITKKRSSGTTDNGWSCWHKYIGGNYGIWLNSYLARNPSMWGGHTNISSTMFSPPDLNYGNENNQTYVNYLWSEVPGFSKFGRYEGTANAGIDGPFIECGFKPVWVVIKSIDVGTSWYLFDDVRGSIQSNGSNAQVLFPDSPNVSDSANGGQGIDFLSNGFKVRCANGYGINNQLTYIYAAFAEAPTINLYGGQANAR